MTAVDLAAATKLTYVEVTVTEVHQSVLAQVLVIFEDLLIF